MKNKIVALVLAILVLVFFVVWINKANNPSSRQDSNTQNSQWYDKAVKTKADNEWILDPEIPENYIPMPGEKETYMVVDTQGNITAYRHRTKTEDGSWIWSDIESDGNYKVVSETNDGYIIAAEDGYHRYLRNEDNSYAFVDCDENGNDMENTDATVIPSNYICVSSNIYAIYNEHGVITGYKERHIDENGNYIWVNAEKPIDAVSSNSENETAYGIPNTDNNGKNQEQNQEIQTEEQNNNDGTLTKISSYTEKVQEGSYLITYKTTIYKVYDSDGNLISTKKEGPTEIARTYSVISEKEDPQNVLNDLDAECYRISSKVTYNTEFANEVLEQLNDERITMGLNPVSMANGNLYKLAQIKCADMALSEYANENSALYGTLEQAAAKYGVPLSNSKESLMMTYNNDASVIHAYMQAKNQSREVRMSPDITRIAIVIINKNGYTFVYECYQ